MATPIDRGEVLYQLERLALEAQLTDECEEETIRRCIKAIEQLVPTLTHSFGGVSVEERLPEPVFNGQQRGFYLVALSNGTVKELMYEFRHYENMMFDVGWHETAYPVTHWMPLPAPPDCHPA